MRLFAALEVPSEVRDEIEGAIAPVRAEHDGPRWTRPAQWHLTVAFIGAVDTPPEEVAAVLAIPAAGAPTAIGLRLSGAGRFGRRVLWLGVDDRPDGSVADLGAACQRALRDVGLPIDLRDVHPHLTLARSRGGGARIDPDVVDAVPAIGASWDARELVLYASVPQGRGEPNRYVPQSRLPLGR